MRPVRCGYHQRTLFLPQLFLRIAGSGGKQERKNVSQQYMYNLATVKFRAEQHGGHGTQRSLWNQALLAVDKAGRDFSAGTFPRAVQVCHTGVHNDQTVRQACMFLRLRMATMLRGASAFAGQARVLYQVSVHATNSTC